MLVVTGKKRLLEKIKKYSLWGLQQIINHMNTWKLQKVMKLSALMLMLLLYLDLQTPLQDG
ncbi:hypothetical protein protein [Bacillus cereus G9241]|nr:hypothetical protein protein [Bacillus cereus G9241]